MLPTEVLVWAIILHLVADWPLQTDWMACNKIHLGHAAAWVHSGIHAALLLLVFPWYFALGIGFTHVLIDTRRPVQWWINTFKRIPPSTPFYELIEMWMDQVFHIIVLAAAALLFAATISSIP